jgi:two-component system, OmpR family, response regulator ChvI
MSDTASESDVHNTAEQRSAPAPERTFRVLTTGDIRDSHASLLRQLAPQVAVEEVADAGVVLTRLGEQPLPHLVVLGWGADIDDKVGALRRLHDHGTTVPVLIMQGSPSGPCPKGSAGDADALRVDMVKDAVVRLVTSLGGLVVGTPEPAQDAGAPSRQSERAAYPLELRLDECRALWYGRHVDLSLTEFRVVARLASGAGCEISHRDLYDVVKSQGFVAGAGDLGYRGSVRATIKRIRQKFREVDPEFAAIRNYPGFGYRWVTEAGGPIGSPASS